MSRRKPRAPQPCHTPSKQLYVSRAVAASAAEFAAGIYGPPMEPYQCPCGWWHLTSHPRKDQTA